MITLVIHDRVVHGTLEAELEVGHIVRSIALIWYQMPAFYTLIRCRDAGPEAQ